MTGTGGDTYTLDLGPAFANQYVALYAYSAPTSLGWFLADGSGVVTFTIPSSVQDGTHTIAAYDATGALAGWIGGVTVAAAAPPVVGDPGPELAATGAQSGLPLGGAVALLLTGLVLTVVARTRRRPGRQR